MKIKFILITAFFSIIITKAQEKKSTSTMVVEVSTSNKKAESEERYYSMALAEYKNKNYEEALSIVNQGLIDYQKSDILYELKCYILVAQKDNLAVIKTATKGLDINPENDLFYEIRGNTYYFELKPNEALKDYKKMLSLNQTNARYYNNYLKLLNEIQNDDEIITVYNTFEKKRREREDFSDEKFLGDVYFYSAIGFYRKNNTAQAIKLMNEALKLKPNAESYYVNRGYFYENQNEIEKGIKDLSKAIEINNKNGEHYLGRSSMYLKLNQYENAKNDLLQALRHGNSSLGVYNNLAMSYSGLNDYKSAAAQYEILLKHNPNDVLSLGNYAYCLLEMDKIDESIEKLLQAYKEKPNEIDILIGLVLANKIKNNQENVKKYLNLISENTNKVSNKQLLENLEEEGYSYSLKMKNIWKSIF